MIELTNIKKSVLENENYSISITSQGFITRLYNKATKTEFIKECDATGWKMITTLGEWQEHPVFDYMNNGQILQSEDCIKVYFNNLFGVEDDVLDIKLTLSFSFSEGGKQIEAKAEIHNTSGETVIELWFPFISGFHNINNNQFDCLILPLGLGRRLNDPLNSLPKYFPQKFNLKTGGNFYTSPWNGMYPLMYPGIASMSWMDFCSIEQGIYLAAHAETFCNVALLARGREKTNDFQLGFARYPFVKPGENWVSNVFILRFHDSDWHKGANFYREFSKGRIKSIKRPDWLKNADGIYGLGMKHQNKHVFMTYEQLIEEHRFMKKLGINAPIFLFSWYKGGHDCGYPVYEPDPRMGGKEGLIDAIKTIVEEGGKIILYTQGRLLDKGAEYYKTKGYEIASKNSDGVAYGEEWSFREEGTIYPNKQFACACPSTKEWHEKLLEFLKLVMSFGASGILYDQLGGLTAFLCYDKNHLHEKPDTAFGEGKAEILSELQQYAYSQNPQFIVMGEHYCDAFVQYIDLTHGVDTFRDQSPLEGIGYPELYKYTFPEHLVTLRSARDINDYNFAFITGLVFELNREMISPENPMSNSILKLCSLRKKLGRFFIYGRFVDNNGLKAVSSNVTAKVFVSEDGTETAIAVWNPDKKSVRSEIALERKEKRWCLFYPGEDISKEECTALGEEIIFDIPPESVCVVLVK